MRHIHFLLLTIMLAATSLHAQNLVLNGKFNNDLIGWENSSDTDMSADWNTADANDNAFSGSAHIANLSAAASNGVAIQQCVPVNTGQKYTVAGKVRIPSGSGQSLTNNAVMSVRWYYDPECTVEWWCPHHGWLSANFRYLDQ